MYSFILFLNPFWQFNKQLLIINLRIRSSTSERDSKGTRTSLECYVCQTLNIRLILVGKTEILWWRSWLRCCSTSRKVVGLNPDGVIAILHWFDLSGSTVTGGWGSNHSPTEMSTRGFSLGAGGGVKAASA